ncbi:mitochondrial transcription rescue factor 1 [Diprion similis]|uniref:mitochondrial transcription rescue factor 1 n=1 Tax=Diprion similis TaxID=362088 RepID=UPI001EF7F00C|nr:mitochondrial transcription rescue factor 1 [Diprion similis]
MLCRQLIFSVLKKKSLYSRVQAIHVAFGYTDKCCNVKESTVCNGIASRERNLQIIKRFKHAGKNSNKKQSEEEDDEDDDDVAQQDKTLPTISVRVTSLRADLILKAGLNIARNKVETAFYESKIRINGEKLLKKSCQVYIGDEIDLIHGPSPTNPKFLVVSRVQLLHAKGDNENENIRVKLTKHKSLVIENYDDPWKPTASTDSISQQLS